ncbi:hypothetical protein ACQUFY_05005 [Robbsia andropogonis]
MENQKNPVINKFVLVRAKHADADADADADAELKTQLMWSQHPSR